MEWIDIRERFPTELGKDIIIYYLSFIKLDNGDIIETPIVETGYLCGVNIVKGSTERYPDVLFWMEMPLPPSE